MNPCRIARLPVLFLLLCASCPAAETRAPANAADVYHPVFSNVSAWGRSHRDALDNRANFSNPAAARAYAELTPQLRAMSAAAGASFVDWGTRFDAGIASQMPQFGDAVRTVRAANWAARYAAAQGLPECSGHAIEAIRLGRNIGEDGLLLNLLAQVSAEIPALELLADQVARMETGEVAALDAGLKVLPAGATLADALLMEKAVFVDTLVHQLLHAMRETDPGLFEEVYGAPQDGISAEGGAGSWFARNLRLTSIVDAGRGWKIGFEMRDGDQFTVQLGRPARGIELLSVDFERGEAVIARSNETALVTLKTREIHPFAMRFRLPPAEERRRLARDPDFLRRNPMLAAIAALESVKKDENAEVNLLASIGDSPDALFALLTRTSDEYARWIDACQRLPQAEFKPFHEDLLQKGTPITRLLLPAAGKVIEKDAALQAARKRLADAVAVRLRR